MALKPDRYTPITDINWKMNTVAEAGGVACASVTGSGSQGDAANVVAYVADPSGAKPIGLLLTTVVDIPARGHENWEKQGYQARKGGKVDLLTHGWVRTNSITGSPPSGVEPAYLGPSGLLTRTQAPGAPQVGRFLSKVDQDGYARVDIKI